MTDLMVSLMLGISLKYIFLPSNIHEMNALYLIGILPSLYYPWAEFAIHFGDFYPLILVGPCGDSNAGHNLEK